MIVDSHNCNPADAATLQGDCREAGWIQKAVIYHCLRSRKKLDLAPDSWGAYEKNEFCRHRGLHLPRLRMLNSWTWYLIFDAQTAESLCYKLVQSLTSPPASLEQSLKSKMLSPGLQSSLCPQIKLNSQVSSYAYFLVDTHNKHFILERERRRWGGLGAGC